MLVRIIKTHTRMHICRVAHYKKSLTHIRTHIHIDAHIIHTQTHLNTVITRNTHTQTGMRRVTYRGTLTKIQAYMHTYIHAYSCMITDMLKTVSLESGLYLY